MRLLTAIVLLLSPTLAIADERCEFTEPRSLELDLAGARSVQFLVNSHDLHLRAVPGNAVSLSGRACASGADRLKSLQVSQRREGDRLIVELLDTRPRGLSLRNHSAFLDIQATVPDRLLVLLDIGSGDVWASGGNAVGVGSGDAAISNVNGRVTAKVGSGDLKLRNIGPLKLLGVGSGDVIARDIRGPVEIGSVGSGDLKLATVKGPVEIGSIGSGDVSITTVEGSVTVASIGSGDLKIENVSGDLSLQRKGSGDLRHRDVRGKVSLPNRD